MMPRFSTKHVTGIIISPMLFFFSCTSHNTADFSTWPVYGGTNERIQYSSLSEIDTTNVKNLQVAWTYHTGDAEPSSQIEVNPVISDGLLYGVSPKLKLFALDETTGKEKWVFDPYSDTSMINAKRKAVNICRGVALYKNGDERLVFYTAGPMVYCINAIDGKPVRDFGNNGTVDLHNDLGRELGTLYITSTSPGMIYKDLIIIGSAVSEDASAPPGHIRAYDVHTGKLRWIFHTIPYPGEDGYDIWEDKEAYKHIGGANAWAGFCLDESKGIVFAPIGSATDDWYGGKRIGDDLFANCVLALDAATGKRIWHYQTVHHDVWDRDLPAAPVLVTVKKDGQNVEALVQVTKTGFIFLLDRATGKPLYPVEERPVPTSSDLAGEKLSPTQPHPTFFEPYVRQKLTVEDLNKHISDSSYQDIKNKLAGYKTGNLFNPPSLQPTVIFPGMQGGAEWGGPAFDPATGILYVNANEMPWVLTMVDVKNEAPKKETWLDAGQRLYKQTCMTCHGPERKGAGNAPSLIGVNKKYNEQQFTQLITGGRRMMPAFKQLTGEEQGAIASFILEATAKQKNAFKQAPQPVDTFLHLPYSITGYNKFLSKEGYNAMSPPWGTLNAIDLNKGEIVWKIPLGEYPELKDKAGITGTENYGGPVVTAGGILFIAASRDGKIRAFNKATGKQLWEATLPAPGFATPAVYEKNGKEYLVIACGGGKLGTKPGDAYVAFALPGK